MAVRLSKRRNEELVSGNHIALHKFMNFQGREVVELRERYDIGSFGSPRTECWICMLPDNGQELFVFTKIDSFTKNDYERFKSG